MKGNTSSERVDTAWLKEHAAPTPLVPVVWTWGMIALQIYYIQHMIRVYGGGDSSDFTPATFVNSQVAVCVYAWVMANYVFPKAPAPLGIPFLLIALAPGFLACAYPFLASGVQMGATFAKSTPLWVLVLWGCLRCQFESCVQMHAHFGVGGISKWLLWPTQSTGTGPYTMRYLGLFTITRAGRGGNPDASGSFFMGLPCAIITYMVSPNGENDHLPWLRNLNWVVHTLLLVNLFWGPFLHICGGMPGMTTANPLHNDGRPRRALQMHGMFRGVLGTIMVSIASFAMIHTFVFYRKFYGYF